MRYTEAHLCILCLYVHYLTRCYTAASSRAACMQHSSNPEISQMQDARHGFLITGSWRTSTLRGHSSVH